MARGSRGRRFFVASVVVAAAALAAVPTAAARDDVAYVTTLGSGVFAYDVDPASGALTPLQGSPFPGGHDGFGVTATPDRQHLYVSNYGDSNLASFDIAAGSGALSPGAGSPFSTRNPVLSAVTPNGDFLYVANDANTSPASPGSVSGFAIDYGTGGLTPVPGSPVAATDPGPFGPVVSPDGEFLYVSNTGNSPSAPGSVSAFQIDPDTGALTEIQGSPYVAEIAPGGVAMTPDGQRLYVANGESATLSAFNRNETTGALTPISGSPFPVGTGEPTGVAITPDGTHLYTANGSMSVPADNQVWAFSIDQGSGALTGVPGSPYAAGVGPQFIAITGDGAHLYVTNNGSQDISGYAIDATSGALSALGGSPFATGTNPLGIAIPPEPSNEFSFGKLKKQKRKGKARLSLDLPGPGVVEFTGKDIKHRNKHIDLAVARRGLTSAGAAGDKPRVSVAPKGKAKRRLRRRGSSKVKVAATYTPDGGTPNEKSKRVRLVKR
jgi:6-phosphogluconolactonase